ncbi:kinesin-like protein KIF15 isoform X1 [Hydra vulgaris]|uniref:kinesin-like protein KIF15 isoform X1 n=1 Tax=Hydra vulgaris TaxID=6087 RepID=UPI001F5E57AD|nr:kinesin-like protein KIF15 [Hydra vulgaris]XP_047130902.1 kinesin-like protein KIF15 [Hydra vulgaris]
MDLQTRIRVNKVVSKTNSEIINTSIASNSAGYDRNEGDNIKVYIRIRPPLKHVQDGINDTVCLEATTNNSVTIFTKPEPKQFSYDFVANMETTQEEVFTTVGKGIIEAFVNGFNGTIFAYGQTGSGKTFTMMGPPGDDGIDTFTHEMRGVIPRCFEYMFSLINREQEKIGDRVEFLATCSFLEIYNEQVYDLISPSTAGLQLRENIKKGVFVDSLAERDVCSAKDAYRVLESGWLNRRVASTSMNRESSRSHAVFTVSLSSKRRVGGMANIKVAKLHLVDLAGSERQKDTNTQDLRLKEAGSINKSLSALGNVIMALVDITHGKTRHVHYRDSKLTFMLRDSLGGNAKTYIIANIHPSSRYFGETLSTLNFACRAKMIKNKAIVNEDVTGNVMELQAEIRKLKEMLSQSRSYGPSVTSLSVCNVENNTSAGDLDDTVHWKEMMLNAIARSEQSEQEKSALQMKVLDLEELCRKKEMFAQSQKMIIKFRNDTISKLKSASILDKDSEVIALKDEIKLLHSTIDNHPEVKRLAVENLELRAELKRLKSLDPSNGDVMKSMAEKHRYTLQLERQLRDSLQAKSPNNLEKSSAQQSIDALNNEIEKLKLELTQVQAKLDTSKIELEKNRQNLQQKCAELVCLSESFRKKELDLKSDLVAARKCNSDLERALETLQLKTAVERSTMNNLHMQTIKTLSSPNKLVTPQGTPKKAKLFNDLYTKVSTPSLNKTIGNDQKESFQPEKKKTKYFEEEKYVNDPDRFIQDEPHPKFVDEDDSFDELSKNEFNPFWNLADETQDEEVEYMEAIQKEIKHLQDLYNQSSQALHTEQAAKIILNEAKFKLEHKVNELEQLLEHERNQWNEKEKDYTIQLLSIKEKYNELQEAFTMLTSDAENYKSQLLEAQKLLNNLKDEKCEEASKASRKYAVVESKCVKLEIDLLNLRTEMDATAEENNNLQAGFENCKEELEFYRHKNFELEQVVEEYKKKLKEEEDKLQVALEKLNNEMEMEMKMKLSQEDKHAELMRSVETINALQEELNVAAKKLDDQNQLLEKMQADLEKSRSEVIAQKWMNMADKEAINNFMKTVQELQTTIIDKESRISSLTLELEDIKQQHDLLQISFEKKKVKITKLTETLQCESSKLAKEKEEREKDALTFNEDVSNLRDQLDNCFLIIAEKNKELKVLEENHELLKEDLNKKTIALDHEIHNKKSSVLEVVNTDTLTEMLSESLEASKQEDLKEIERLRKQLMEYEVIQSGQEALEGQIKFLETELEDLEKEKMNQKQKEKLLEDEISSYRECMEREKALAKEALFKRDQAINEKHAISNELAECKMNMFNIQEDLDAVLEELEKTKSLEEKYFNEKIAYQSKLEIIEEEKKRIAKEIELLQKENDAVKVENAKLAGHHNHSQRIKVLMDLKNEIKDLKENNDYLRQELISWKQRYELK